MGGMGGSVAASMARALGAGRIDDARGLVVHALVLAVASGLVFTGFAWSMAPALYALMGGVGGALEAAVAYSHVWFAGAVLLWLFAFLSSLLRGGGDAATPGLYGLASSIVYVPLAGILALGIGPWPGLGLVGLAIASMVTTGAIVLLLGRVLWRGRLGFVPAFAGVRLQRRLFAEILRVGLLGSLTTLDRQRHGHGDGRPGRPLRRRRAGRLRHRRAPGVHGGADRLRHRHRPHHAGRRGGRRRCLAARRQGCLDRRAHLVRRDRADRLDGGAGARELGAPVRLGCRGRRRQRRLHHARGAVLLPVRARPHALLREPGCGSHGRARRRRCRAHGRDDPRRLACRREVRSGIGRCVRGDCRRDGRLWRPDGGTVARDAVGGPVIMPLPRVGERHEGGKCLSP